MIIIEDVEVGETGEIGLSAPYPGVGVKKGFTGVF
jgi:hypothetical protein